MKKTIKLIFIIITLLSIILFTLKSLKKEHKVSYELKNYEVVENFYLEGKKNWYDITIKDKNNFYYYSLNENLNKSKKIIKDIKVIKENNLTCIVPIYKKYIEKNIYCNKNNSYISTHYLISEDNEDFNKILEKAKKYNLKIPKENNSKIKYKKIEVYKNNIPNDYKFLIWDYKGIYIIDRNNSSYQKILNYDLYENLMSTPINRYYVLFENTSVNGIENIYYFDIIKNKLHTFKLKNKLSKDSYINGTIDDSIFITDNKKKKQYTFNIKNKELEEIGNEEKLYQVYENGKQTFLSKSDFFQKKQYFKNALEKDKIITSKNIKKEYNYLYYLEDNKMYRAINSNKKDPELLFELANIKDWQIVDRDILLIAEDTLYLYTDNVGLRKILKSSELNYNYKDICKMWKK